MERYAGSGSRHYKASAPAPEAALFFPAKADLRLRIGGVDLSRLA
jgi:hypothetical protein